MGKRIEPVLANEKQVHQLPVIRHEGVEAVAGRWCARPARIANRQRQHIAVAGATDRGFSHKRTIAHHLAIGPRLDLPPGIAAPERESGQDEGGSDAITGATTTDGIGSVARRHDALTHSRADEREKPNRQEYTERDQDRAQPRRHRTLGCGNREHGNDRPAGPRRSLDIDGHLI